MNRPHWPTHSHTALAACALAAAIALGCIPPSADALSHYHLWRDATFGNSSGDPSIAGNTRDPEWDGLPNLVEYAAGSPATAPNEGPAPEAGAVRCAIRFDRNPEASGVTLTVQSADHPGGPWTDVARSAFGAPCTPLLPDIQVAETGSGPVRVTVADNRPASGTGHFMRLSAQQKPTGAAAALLQGQSNAVDMFTNATWFGGDAGYRSIFRGLVRDLTGIPTITLYGADNTSGIGNRTVVGGTYLYHGNSSNTAVWMSMNGTDPAAWPLAYVGEECDRYIRTRVRGNVTDTPLALLRVHSEYDSRHDAGNATFYRAANRAFVAKLRDAAGLSARQMPVFYGQVPYSQGIKQPGIDAVRSAWRDDVADPAMNARYAWGAVNDEGYWTDNVHMGLQACRQANARMAFAYARWLYDNGYANTDLSTLPTTGPAIASFRRGPAPNQIDISIRHDTGTDIVIPPNVRLEGFVIIDPGSTPPPNATAAQRVDPNTLRLTLDKNLSANASITLDYLGLVPSPFSDRNFMYGAGRLISDNYHLLDKPPHIAAALANNYSATSNPPATTPLTFPLCRMAAPITIDP